MSIIKMRGPINVLFAFKIFSLPVPVPELFGKYPTRPVPKSKTPTRQTLRVRFMLTSHFGSFSIYIILTHKKRP